MGVEGNHSARGRQRVSGQGTEKRQKVFSLKKKGKRPVPLMRTGRAATAL
jgi:hypothetical protein